MISDNIRVSKGGDVTGDIYYLSGMSSYPKEEQSGHYFPMQFDSKLYNTELHVGGKPSEEGFTAGKNFTPTEVDPYLIIRVENCTDENKVTVYNETTKDELFTLNFSPSTLAPPVGKDAVTDFQSVKVDFGNFGKTTDFWDEPPTIVWDGKAGKVTGTLKPYEGEAIKLEHGFYYLPIVTSEWYSEKPVSVYCKNPGEPKAETDWVIRLTDTATPITMKYNGETVVTLDLTGLVLTPKEG